LAVFSLRLPELAQRASVDVEDMESDRTARSTFELVRPAGRAVIRLLRSGRISVGAVYGLGDTVEVAVRIPGWVADSVEFVVGLSGRPPATLRTQARDSAGVGVAVLAVPVADSVGRPRLKSGLYRVTARPAPDSGQTWSASAGFEVRLPFYHDDSAYFERVEQLAYVATVEQIRWLRAVPPAARDTAWGTFWKPMDPSPATPENEREREYFERIDYATEHFGRPDRGFRSDRARVYVKFGPPDQVESKPFEIDRPARETWYYYERGLAVSFVDRFGWGEFLLEAPREPDEQ
jgi:GWxTD domain-containing protein